jgi:hypothetical protein
MADLFTRYPANPGYNAVNFKVNTPTQISETFSGKFRRVGLGVSYYTWELRYTNLVPIDAGTIKGYLSQTLGPQFSFEIILPKISVTALPTQTSQVVRTAANASIGSTSVSVTNAGATQNILAAGDYFKFANHSKVYMCVSPCISNSSGNATLFFSGPLLQAVPTSTNLTITQVPFTAVLAEDVQEWDVGIGGITNLSVSMREVF